MYILYDIIIFYSPNIKEEDLASYLDYADLKSNIGSQDGLVNNLFETGETSVLAMGDIFERDCNESGGEERLNLSLGPSSI